MAQFLRDLLLNGYKGVKPIETIQKGNNLGQQVECKGGAYHIGGKKYYQEYYTKTNGSGAMMSSDYMRSLLQKRHCLPTPPNRQHFPPNINHDGCDINALTPAEAIGVGLLPLDWKG